MALHNCGAVPVVDADDLPIGIVTDRDIALRAIGLGLTSDATAGACMSTPVITVPTDATLRHCADAMEAHQIRRLVVVGDNGPVTGILAQAELARTAPDELVSEIVEEVSLNTRATF
jgi:CBS domain-containing protein